MSGDGPSPATPTPHGAPGSTPPAGSAIRHPPPIIPDHELIRRIGAGAYGEVWLARNTLGAYRAVKVIYRSDFDSDHPYDREFAGIRKAEPISRTHHSQVDILHVGRGDGHFYYVMELADCVKVRDQKSEAPGHDAVRLTGERGLQAADYTPHTLKHDLQHRGRLPPDECIEIGLSLATALAHLHQNGLVHRDVKPSNIIFIGGAPKLADIGLVTDADTTFSYVGTEGYVAPEGPGAPQADIYALGKVLYEISTGKDRKEYPLLPPELRSAPEAGRIVELNAVILKACARNLRERYASAEALRADLELLRHGGSVREHRARQRFWSVAAGVGAAAAGLAALAVLAHWMSDALSRRTITAPGDAGGEASVFVLPFRYVAPDSEPVEETERALWLCGRITDAFIDGLAFVPGLSTGPRKSDWLRFDEDEVRRAVVRTNTMRYLLSGRVDCTNDLLGLRLRLYRRDDDAPRWERTFVGTTNEVIGLERSGLDQLAKVLGREVDPHAWDQIGQVLTNNYQAYRWFLQARAHHLTVSRNEYRKALDCFDRALALDRKYVTAHEGYIELFREFFGVRPPEELWPVLADRAQQVLELDDTSFVAHDRLLDKMILYDRDWERAVVECDRQSKIWPERLVSWSVRYRWLGRTNESRLYHEPLRLSRPVNAIERQRALQHLAFGESVWRNHDEAIRLARQPIQLAPDGALLGQYNLGRCLLWAGRYREAIDALLQSTSDWPSPELDGLLGRAYALVEDRTRALGYLERLEEREQTGDADPYFLAWIHEALGNKDQALECLNRAIDYRSECIVHTEFGGLRTDPAWDNLREDPRFEALCRRVDMGKDQWPK